MDEEPPSVEAAVRAGAALFTDGYVLAAHDPWEAAWLPLDASSSDPIEAADERLLHGLIAISAATHHARSRNWSGAVGCAENGVKYLSSVDDRHRRVHVSPLREWARRLAADPDVIDRDMPPDVRVSDTRLGFSDLDFDATMLAAPALADALDRRDSARDSAGRSTLEQAVALARDERNTAQTTVTELVFAFCRVPNARPQIRARLADHVDRAERKRRDVEDLF